MCNSIQAPISDFSFLSNLRITCLKTLFVTSQVSQNYVIVQKSIISSVGVVIIRFFRFPYIYRTCQSLFTDNGALIILVFSKNKKFMKKSSCKSLFQFTLPWIDAWRIISLFTQRKKLEVLINSNVKITTVANNLNRWDKRKFCCLYKNASIASLTFHKSQVVWKLVAVENDKVTSSD